MRDDYSIRRGDYSIYRFTDQIYKVIKFKSVDISPKTDSERAPVEHYDHKLDTSYSRTRRLVLEKALCNPWDWFCTLTLDPRKFDRYNLKLFYDTFSQWLRDQRKKGCKISYLLVPELHDDGAWHLHGFFYDLPELVSFRSLRSNGFKVPDKLVYSDFYCWLDYWRKFGYCSFGKIRSPVRSAFYISKYITKDHSRLVSELNCKMYYCNTGLNCAVKHDEIYGSSAYLDSFLQQHYDFCSVGMTRISDGLDWSFAMELSDAIEPLFDSSFDSSNFFDSMSVLNIESFDQISIGDFL